MVVASFANQIQQKYYVGNIYVSIEDIALEHFSAAPQAYIMSSTLSGQHHAVFCSFLFDNRKHDSATTTAHSKRYISFLRNKKY